MRVIWLGLVALAACGDSTPQAAGSADGAALFGMHCATCHGPHGKPDATMAARLGVRDLTDPAVRARLTPTHVEQQIRKGSQNKLMPAFEGGLSIDQIRAISAWVTSDAFLQQR